MTAEPWPSPRTAGFTLIEVIAALLIFSVGVLMVIQVSGALTQQMQYAARSSEIVALAHERLDSLEATPFDSLASTAELDTLTVDGVPYIRTLFVTPITGMLKQLHVTLYPVVTGAGPVYSVTSYTSSEW